MHSKNTSRCQIQEKVLRKLVKLFLPCLASQVRKVAFDTLRAIFGQIIDVLGRTVSKSTHWREGDRKLIVPVPENQHSHYLPD